MLFWLFSPILQLDLDAVLEATQLGNGMSTSLNSWRFAEEERKGAAEQGQAARDWSRRKRIAGMTALNSTSAALKGPSSQPGWGGHGFGLMLRKVRRAKEERRRRPCNVEKRLKEVVKMRRR